MIFMRFQNLQIVVVVDIIMGEVKEELKQVVNNGEGRI